MLDKNLSFTKNTEILARALLVGEKLDLKALEHSNRLGSFPLTLAAGENGCAVLFRYGAVVFFGVEPLEEKRFLDNLHTMVSDPFEKLSIEEFRIKIEPSSEERVDSHNGTVILHEPSLERLQIMADILAKSVMLSYYETTLAMTFDQIEPLAANLQGKSKKHIPNKTLLLHIGNSLMIQHKMVGRAEVAEKPDVLWDRPDLERLYARLVDEHELREREVALERKLVLISDTAETLLDLFQAQRSLRVEWYIVALIVFEILLSLYDRFS